MLCEDCKQKNATIHYTQVSGGVSHEMHLCAACMQKRKKGLDLGDMQGLLSSLLSGMEATGEEAEEKKSAGAQRVLKCSRCGMEFSRFRKTGMLGCAQCYQDFRLQLAPILKRIHGRVEHAGHVPPGVGRERLAREEMLRLKKEMDEAVALEDFERAALLRDQIRAISAEDKRCRPAQAACAEDTAKEAEENAQ